MIAFTCGCGERLAAAPDDAGATVRCPNCGATLDVPEPGYELTADDHPAPPPADTREGREPVRRLMAKAHADLDEDEAKRARERRPVVFTPGLVGGATVFVVCSLLAVGSLLLYNLYLAIGLLVFAVGGLFRAVLSFVGRGVD
jgi:hypothetical protein